MHAYAQYAKKKGDPSIDCAPDHNFNFNLEVNPSYRNESSFSLTRYVHLCMVVFSDESGLIECDFQ